MSAARRSWTPLAKVLGATTVVVVTLALVIVVVATRAQSSACSAAAPIPSLSGQLLSLGDFGQAYDATDVASLEDAAQRVAQVLHPDLSGAQAQAPVDVGRSGSANYDAEVVPLSVLPGGPQPPRVVGLVAFLRDCAGHAYYSAVQDQLTTTHTGVLSATFPAVSEQAAAHGFGGAPSLRLVYASSPFAPRWLDPATGASVSATVAG